MIIDDLIETYRSLSAKNLAEQNGYKTQTKKEYWAIRWSFSASLATVIVLSIVSITSMPFFDARVWEKISFALTIISLSIFLITIFSLKGYDDVYILDNNQQKIDINELRNKRMQELIKEKYIIANKDNPHFFSYILQSIDTYDKKISRITSLKVITVLVTIIIGIQGSGSALSIYIFMYLFLLAVIAFAIKNKKFQEEISNTKLFSDLKMTILDMQEKDLMKRL